MEAAQSKTFLSKPWREIQWTDKTSDLKHVDNYQPETEDQLLRILLHGPVGAGKSSFINSVQSVLHGRMYTQALANNIHQGSFTKEYITYKIPKGNTKTFYPFVFNDMVGLDASDVLVNDIKLALKGHVKEGYRMERISLDVGIPMNCIFPVKNYHEEIKLNSDVNSLTLSSLKNIINFGKDYIVFHNSRLNFVMPK